MRLGTKKLVSTWVALTIFTQPVAFAKNTSLENKSTSPHHSLFAEKKLPQHEPAFDGQGFEGLGYFPKPEVEDEKAWNEFLAEEVRRAQKTNIDKVTESGDSLVQLMIQYKNFYLESREKMKVQIGEIGYEQFLKEYLEANKVKYDHPELGRMEFTNVDGVPVGKIVHKKSGVAFIIYDENSISRDSEHFLKYEARQHYDAGATRKDTKYIDENGRKKKISSGRDCLLMGIKDFDINPDSLEVSARKRGLTQWWKATYKQPSKSDTVMGVISGIAQFFSIGALAQAVAWVLPGFEAGNTPELIATFTLAYGSLFGVWNSFYQNWRSRGPVWVRDAKNMAVSFSYYFGVYLISQGSVQHVTVHDFSLDPSTVVAFIQSLANPLIFAAAAHPIHNFYANLKFKNVGYWLQRIPEVERTDRHNLSIMIPKGWFKNEATGKREFSFWKIPTPMPRRFWNRQFLFYLPVNWAKFLDQVWFGWTIGPAMRGEYPEWVPFLSVIGFWGLIFSSVRGVNWWAHKNHKEAADYLKIREESKYYYLIDKLLHDSWTGMKTKMANLKNLLGDENVGRETELINSQTVRETSSATCRDFLTGSEDSLGGRPAAPASLDDKYE